MLADLALVDEALLVLVHELQRVLDGDDVVGAGPVDVVDERAECGRLAGAGGTGHQHQALGQMAQLQDLLREPHLLGGHDAARDDAEDPAHALAVHEEVAAEAREARDLVGKVGVVPPLELLAIAIGRDRPQDALGVGRREDRTARQRLHVPVVPDHRRRAHRDVEVGGIHRDHRAEQILDLGRGPRGPRRRRARRGRSRRHGRRGGGRRAVAEGERGEGAGRPSLGARAHRPDPRHLEAPLGEPCRQGPARIRGQQRGQELVDRGRRLLGPLHLTLSGRRQDHDAAARHQAHLLAAGLDGGL